MTLRKKLLSVNLMLLAGVIALAGSSLWGLLRQRSHVRASLREYGLLKWVESAQIHVLSAKSHLHDTPVDRDQVAAELRGALDDVRSYKAVLSSYDQVLPAEIGPGDQSQAKALTRSVANKLTALTDNFDP